MPITDAYPHFVFIGAASRSSHDGSKLGGVRLSLLRTAVHLLKIYLQAIKNNSAMGRDPLRTRHQKSNYEFQVGRVNLQVIFILRYVF